MIKSREEWVSNIRGVSLLPSSTVLQKDGKWTVIQRKEAWDAAAPRIFDEHLDRFRKVAVEVLRERDPKFELEPDQRFAASIYDKALKHSEELRKGLSETLAILGSFPATLTSCSHGKAEGTAVLAVREILADADSILWGSLNYHLPMLAEAAPDEFLDAVEKAVSEEPSPFRAVYEQESAGIAGRNYMTGLLWALETLAWRSDYLTRVVVAFGELANIDPGGNWTNRPENSLRDILLPWYPQTTADIPRRKTALLALLHEQPEVGWRLLLGLLPSSHRSTSGTRKPKWRSFVPAEFSEKVSTQVYWEQVGIYADIALSVAMSDLRKLPSLIERFSDLPNTAAARLLEFVASESVVGLPEPARRSIWEALASLGARHRKYAGAVWAMMPDAVAEIEAVASKLEPASAIMLHRRLFSGREFDLFEKKGDYEVQRQSLAAKREAAIIEIIEESGVEGVLAFAQSVDSPWRVGFSLGVVANPAVDAFLLPPSNLSDEQRHLEELSRGFVLGRFHSKGWDWVDNIEFGKWRDTEKGTFLTWLPFCRETWLRVERLLGTDSSAYWRSTSANAYQAEEGDLAFAAEQLLLFGRPRAAIEALDRLANGAGSVPSQLVIRALQAALTSDEPEGSFDQHSILELIKWLQDHADEIPDQLSQIEWSYLPLLEPYSGGGSPKTLILRLAKEPAFYCEVIRAVFRSKNEAEVTEESSEEGKRIAENAYNLLSVWRLPPGCNEHGQLNAGALSAWVEEVKESTKASGHFEVAMSQLGEVLPYSPPDPDGLWIHKAVAEILNAKDGEALRSGFTCELFNMRGTHGFTGGREEREIASGYREKADAVEAAGFHRLATALRELAVIYDRDAERESKRGPYEE